MSDAAGAPLGLFQGFGIELEYMIVDGDTLDVMPVCDRLLAAASGTDEAEIERDELAWSNELALHVVELKTNGPAPSLSGLSTSFQADVREIDALLDPLGARLMPGAMHPWMNPDRETRLWPHEYNDVYRAFDRIFGCRGHGWSNLQSMHVNLPFADDEEFGRLHAAIRVLLPILPALAASSPAVDGALTAQLDHRLHVYRRNSTRVPDVAGRVVPEPAWTRAEYQGDILEPLFAAIAPHDPEGVLRHEWLNARGAIARFDRDAIEIRVLDIQECPAADLAIAHAVAAVLRALCEERWCSLETLRSWGVEPLAAILDRTIVQADGASIADGAYLALFGIRRDGLTAGELWRELVSTLDPVAGAAEAPALTRALDVILERGCLARRIASAAAGRPLREVYAELCDCLRVGAMFGNR